LQVNSLKSLIFGFNKIKEQKMDSNQISGNSFNKWEQPYNSGQPAVVDQSFVAKYITKVYGWMFLGLAITAIVAFLVASSPAAQSVLFGNRIVFFGLFLGQIFLVGFLSLRIQKMSSTTATAIFLGYAALMGLTFAVFILAYSATSLMTVFAITAGTFGVMSAVGISPSKTLPRLAALC
jgi:uncharacterized protein